MRVAREAADNTVARILQLVEEAKASQRADRSASSSASPPGGRPAAMLVSALVVLHAAACCSAADWQTWLYRGLAVLLIACPCALVISAPAAMASGLSAGARPGCW